jgi:hypothetical protein
VLERFGLGSDALALACASHSSEPVHLEVTDRMLKAIGCIEEDLACGPHPPLGPKVARDVAAKGIHPTPRWSNCSGKHSGMLALARHHGWPTKGYELAGHPVQDRIMTAITRWTGLDATDFVLGVDGCTVVCHGLPVSAMARAYASLGAGATPELARVRDAMLEHPLLIAGEGRICTELMQGDPGPGIREGRRGGNPLRCHPLCRDRHRAQSGGRGHASVWAGAARDHPGAGFETPCRSAASEGRARIGRGPSDPQHARHPRRRGEAGRLAALSRRLTVEFRVAKRRTITHLGCDARRADPRADPSRGGGGAGTR